MCSIDTDQTAKKFQTIDAEISAKHDVVGIKNTFTYYVLQDSFYLNV